MSAEIPKNEYAPFYDGYVQKSHGTEILDGLSSGLKNMNDFFASFPINKLEYRYAEGKWTPKEIVLHLIDAERVFAYRSLLISRSDNAQIQGFDQDEFVSNSKANERSIESLLEEYNNVRKASVSLFSSLDNKALMSKGMANNTSISVRAIGKIIAGHEMHHLAILKERYL